MRPSSTKVDTFRAPAGRSSSLELQKRVAELQVLYEDNHILAVVKPAGISTQGNDARRTSLLDVARNWLREKYQKPGNVYLGLIHRLDRPVAGVVVFGKTSKGASRLSEQFRTRVVKKIYWAIVEGEISEESGELQHYMGRGEEKVEISTAPKPGFVRAQLRYRLLKRFNQRSLLEIELLTGRKHQIRAQFSLIGHPVWGDGKYGARESSVKGDRIGLLAKRIEFFHPVRSDERIVVEAPENLLSFS